MIFFSSGISHFFKHNPQAAVRLSHCADGSPEAVSKLALVRAFSPLWSLYIFEGAVASRRDAVKIARLFSAASVRAEARTRMMGSLEILILCGCGLQPALEGFQPSINCYHCILGLRPRLEATNLKRAEGPPHCQVLRQPLQSRPADQDPNGTDGSGDPSAHGGT